MAASAAMAGGAASLVGGAALGAVFGELLKAVLEMTDRVFAFKPTLAYLRSTLEAIAPIIKEIQQHNDDLGRPKKELERLVREMEEGTKLVRKCSKIHRWNYLKRIHYQEQLVNLVESLLRYFIIDMQAKIARDLTETLLEVRRILRAVNKLPLGGTDETTCPMAVVHVSESDKIHDSIAPQQAETAFGTDFEQVTENISQVFEHFSQVTMGLSSNSSPLLVDANESKIHDSTDSAKQVTEDITNLTQEVGQFLCKLQLEAMQSGQHTVRVSPTIAVIGPQYCVPYPVKLAIVGKVMTLHNEFNVTDVDGSTLFHVKRPHLLSFHNSHVLLDAAGKTIITFRKKMKTIHDRWQVFSGESTEENNLVCSVKQSSICQLKTKLDVFLANNTKEEVCDFKVKGSLFGRSYAVYAGESLDIVALMHKKRTVQSIMFGQDNFVVTVYPNIDYALIVALIVILDEIN